ncbi:MAG: SRPBCC family protein [Dehalococcoidia bacterium]
MARWETTIEVDAPAESVWPVMSDVAKWPEWTSSIVSVDEVRPDFGLGSTAVVDAKGTPTSRWTVSKWEPGRGFDWVTKVRGATTVGGHWIEPRGERSQVTLTIEVKGPLVWMFKPFIKGVIMTNMATEAAGLKRKSESVKVVAAPTA